MKQKLVHQTLQLTLLTQSLTPLIAITVVVMLLAQRAYAESEGAERVIWQKAPIVVELATKQERRIHFPQAIRYWLPDALQNRVRAMAADGVLYLQAHGAFDPSRIRVQVQPSNKVYLLDLVHSERGGFASDLIVTDAEFEKKPKLDTSRNQPQDDWLVRLIRFAAQSMVAPERIKPHDHNIRPLPLPENRKAALIDDISLDTQMVASWRGGGLTVTALNIRNLGDRPVLFLYDETPTTHAEQARWLRLDKDLKGQWLAVSAQHGSLAPSGYPDDHSYLYLISEHSFELASQGEAL